METIPLYNFFSSLQEYDRKALGREPLTLDEYLLAIQALESGIGLFSENDLRDVCRFLWRKPYHAPEVFDELFEFYRISLRAHLEAKNKGKNVDATSANTRPQGAGISSGKQDPMEIRKPKKGNMAEKDQAVSSQTFGSMSVTDKWLSLPQTVQKPLTEYESQKGDLYDPLYTIDNRYLPADLTPRRVNQLLLSVRFAAHDKYRYEIDWHSTIAKSARNGYLLEPILKRQVNYFSGLTILVDCSPSMVAFEDLTKSMQKLMSKYPDGIGLVYYFLNCPVEYVYEDRDQVKCHGLLEWINGNHRRVMIVSDAGAARGYENPGRINDTYRFLDMMQRHQVVWLNPLPERRWKGSSAAMIAHRVNMFEGNDAGLVAAIRYMKRKNG